MREPLLKLNLACGDVLWPGFVNSDIHRDEGTEYADLTEYPYPYPAGSAELIILSHFFPMTTTVGGDVLVHSEPRRMFAEFHRILAPGGWFRFDGNPTRIWADGDGSGDEPDTEWFPAHLRMARDELLWMIREAGFDPIIQLHPSQTMIPADEDTRAAITGCNSRHVSFSIEAGKP